MFITLQVTWASSTEARPWTVRRAVLQRCAYWLIRAQYAVETEGRWRRRILQSADEHRHFQLSDTELTELRKVFLALGKETPVPDMSLKALILNYHGPRAAFSSYLVDLAHWADSARAGDFWLSPELSRLPHFQKWMSYWQQKQREGWRLKPVRFYNLTTVWLASFRRMMNPISISFWPQPFPMAERTIFLPIHQGVENPWPIFMLGQIYDVFLEELTDSDPEIENFFDQAGLESGYGISSPLVKNILLNLERVRFQLGLYSELRAAYPQFTSAPWERLLASRNPELEIMRRLSTEYFRIPEEQIGILSQYSMKNFMREPHTGAAP